MATGPITPDESDGSLFDPDMAYDMMREDHAEAARRRHGVGLSCDIHDRCLFGGGCKPCPSCDGDGEILPNPMKPPVLCPECGGTGRSKIRPKGG